MGPLGLPVRKTIEVGNRGLQRLVHHGSQEWKNHDFESVPSQVDRENQLFGSEYGKQEVTHSAPDTANQESFAPHSASLLPSDREENNLTVNGPHIRSPREIEMRAKKKEHMELLAAQIKENEERKQKEKEKQLEEERLEAERLRREHKELTVSYSCKLLKNALKSTSQEKREREQEEERRKQLEEENRKELLAQIQLKEEQKRVLKVFSFEAYVIVERGS